jgi:hypothetical protein
MLIGLIQTVSAARQGDEWKDTAKMPFLVLVVGVMGDVLFGVITNT